MVEYGIDVGSVSVKTAEFEDGRLCRTEYRRHHGEPFNLILAILKKIEGFAGNNFELAVTGNFPKPLAEELGAARINEVEASVNGVLYFHPEIKTVIEIGGQDSKFIAVDRNIIKEFSSNTMCAAGAGIFLDQQAKRLCFEIEDFGKIALESKNPARIAGRCSVFAKSDMIHLQQIGTPAEDLVAGLCLALARNFKSAIARGKELNTPIAFIGGVAGNRGVVQAFVEIFGITAEDLIIPWHYNTIAAIGSVLSARKSKMRLKYQGAEILQKWLLQPKTIGRLPPLNGRNRLSPVFHVCPPKSKTRAYLGIDIGSISTNLVLLDENGTLLARRYLWTRGRPIEVVRQGLAELKKEIADKIEVIGVGTTGSARYLIAEFVGADLVKNEISAQARAAIEIDPQVDTVFEIGGQDSKFISINQGAIVDFEMNKICAAGTGSFLEEQAQALKVKLEEFGDRALEAEAPMNLGERCTVFIGSEIVHHQQNLAEQKNLLAGLGYSIVFNYLNRVVGSKKIGNRIFFQGGVAANKAVSSAFEQTLKKQIIVPPNYDVTGAIGIGLLTRDSGITKTRFKGFDLSDRPYTTKSFTCRDCSNECEINNITIAGEPPLYFGGRCGRYEKKEKEVKSHLPDLFSMRNELFFSREQVSGIEIGIPRVLIFYELFPFFYRFLVNLGFNPILSCQTNRKIVEAGTELSSADTCFPVKAALGHIDYLIKNNKIKRFFIPSVITMPPNSEDFTRSFVCPYVQTLPYLVRAIFGNEIELHAPYLYFDRDKKVLVESLFEFAKKFSRSKAAVKEALTEAGHYQAEVQRKLSEIGKKALREINNTAYVLCSRPYNGYDLGLNLSLPRKIRDLGIIALPIDLLPLDYQDLKADFYNMYWHYGQKILAGAETIRKDERLLPVYLSNFSCGPDSFLSRFFKEKLGNKPMLLLEIDEHSGDAGFITRLEAFTDSIKGAWKRSPAKRIRATTTIKKARTIFIPEMGDGAYVLASSMRHANFNAQVLPAPDEMSLILGRQWTTGRECLPAIITAGDLVKRIKCDDFDPDRSAFFMAQGSGPCRFGQYYKLHRLILNEFGLEDVPIYAPNQGPSLFDDLGPMGIKFLFSVWDGICAVDGLEAKVRKIRPYEKEPGTADAVYYKTLSEICQAIEQGKNIVRILKQANQQLNSIKLEKVQKPKIGIVGEIYVRSQKFSNNFLIKRLEELGCEVSMPSIGEWFFYTNFTRIKNCPWFGQYRRALFTKIFDRYMHWRQQYIYRQLDLESEIGIKELLGFAKVYLHPSFEGEAILSVGKTIEFIKEKFSGVINVMPFTCMPGNIVGTIYKRLKRAYPEFPLLVLSFDGVENAVDTMRLETFVSQARALTYHQ